MHVSQIYLSDGNKLTSPELLGAVNKVKELSTECEYQLFDNDSLREFIKNNYEEAILHTYDQLIPFAYKSDLGRYCILYKMGGWYFDISIKLLNFIYPQPDIQSIAFRDIQIFSGTSWAVSNGVLYSKPHNPVFLHAIATVVKNCKENYYGVSPLCPTGPTVLGSAFSKQGANSTAIFGDLIALTPDRQITNKAFILPDGLIQGFAKNYAPGDLQAEGTNNYIDLYFKKQIYKVI